MFLIPQKCSISKNHQCWWRNKTGVVQGPLRNCLEIKNTSHEMVKGSWVQTARRLQKLQAFSMNHLFQVPKHFPTVPYSTRLKSHINVLHIWKLFLPTLVEMWRWKQFHSWFLCSLATSFTLAKILCTATLTHKQCKLPPEVPNRLRPLGASVIFPSDPVSSKQGITT